MENINHYRLFLKLLVLACLFLLPTVVLGEALYDEYHLDQITPDRSDGSRYRITAIELVYEQPHRGHIKINKLMDIKVDLIPTEKGLVATRKKEPYEVFSLRQFQDLEEPQWLYHSALKAITKAIVKYYNQRGIHGVHVAVPDSQIDADETIPDYPEVPY